jgi:hypothetical protein
VLGALLFATARQGLLLSSPLDGRLIDAVSTGAGCAMPPTVDGRRFFILSNGGRFHSFQIGPPLAELGFELQRSSAGGGCARASRTPGNQVTRRRMARRKRSRLRHNGVTAAC